jgi:hypothetical protein
MVFWDVMPCSWVDTYTSEEPAASIYRVEEYVELGENEIYIGMGEPNNAASPPRRLILNVHLWRNLKFHIRSIH